MGLLSYHLIMIVVSMITNLEFIKEINIIDMMNMFPGILVNRFLLYDFSY